MPLKNFVKINSGLTNFMLFSDHPVVFPVVQSIINKSFEEACFPDQLKHAVITPIIKNYALDSEIIKNYQPISNTPFLAKVLEKAAFQQIYDSILTAYLVRINQVINKTTLVKLHFSLLTNVLVKR